MSHHAITKNGKLEEVNTRRAPAPAPEKIRVTIERVTRTEVEVEIPVICPGCGVDFYDGDIDEDNWSAEQIHGAIDYDEKCFQAGGGSECVGEYIVTGYRCGACGHVLTEG